MKVAEIRWDILRIPLLVLISASIAAIAGVYFTHQWSAATQVNLNQAQAALTGIRQKSTQADQEKLLIQRYREAYEELRRSGTIGPEQRVNWLDALRAANQEARTLGVDYQLSQQTAAPISLDTGSYKLQQTTMKLRIKLLHEEDLLNFLHALDNQHAGLYLLQSCNVSRSTSGVFSARFEPKLNAECDLAWLSLADAASLETKKK
jgi:hypothetical protein